MQVVRAQKIPTTLDLVGWTFVFTLWSLRFTCFGVSWPSFRFLLLTLIQEYFRPHCCGHMILRNVEQCIWVCWCFRWWAVCRAYFGPPLRTLYPLKWLSPFVDIWPSWRNGYAVWAWDVMQGKIETNDSIEIWWDVVNAMRTAWSETFIWLNIFVEYDFGIISCIQIWRGNEQRCIDIVSLSIRTKRRVFQHDGVFVVGGEKPICTYPEERSWVLSTFDDKLTLFTVRWRSLSIEYTAIVADVTAWGRHIRTCVNGRRLKADNVYPFRSQMTLSTRPPTTCRMRHIRHLVHDGRSQSNAILPLVVWNIRHVDMQPASSDFCLVKFVAST